MHFSGYELENFMSVVKMQTNLHNRGLVLIEGENLDADAFDSNGSGKSTIFDDGITWVLYGETVRGLKGDAVVNKFVGKNTKGYLQIVDGKDTYEVIRYRKHKDFKNSVILIHNGKTITGKSDTETNQMIIDILQVDFLSFTNSVLFGQRL
jgi:DNA repair exonuclease SbcCD ATPase subunit